MARALVPAGLGAAITPLLPPVGPRPEGRATADPRPGGADRHPVRVAHRPAVEGPAAGDGLRRGPVVLAAPARRAGHRGLGSVASRPCRSGSKEPGNRTGGGRRSTARAVQPKSGRGDGPNPTERGKPGTKRHLVVDARGTPLGLVPTGADADDHRRRRQACRARGIVPRNAGRGHREQPAPGAAPLGRRTHSGVAGPLPAAGHPRRHPPRRPDAWLAPSSPSTKQTVLRDAVGRNPKPHERRRPLSDVCLPTARRQKSTLVGPLECPLRGKSTRKRPGFFGPQRTQNIGLSSPSRCRVAALSQSTLGSKMLNDRNTGGTRFVGHRAPQHQTDRVG